MPDVNAKKKATTSQPIMPEIAGRWSPRAFADRDVEREKLIAILEAARWAPSAFNEQPWRFIIALREDEENYAKMLQVLVPGNADWASSAPVLLLSLASVNFARNGKPNRHAWHDVGLATGNMVIQAMTEGLVMHFMAGFSPEKAVELFKIPEGFVPVAAAALGYKGSIDRIPENFHDAEQGQRSRRPLAESVFTGEFGTSAELIE